MAIPQYKKTLLPNGITLLTETIREMRSVAMGIVAGVGSGQEDPHTAGISHFIEHMAFKGTPKRTAFQIASEIDGVGGKMNAYTSKEVTTYYAVVLDEHIPTAVDVLSDIYLNSLYDPKEMELEKGVVCEEIKMYEDTPDELIHDLFAEAIFHDHPLARPTIGSDKTVRSLKRDDILEYMGRFYTPDNTIISIAGNVEHDKALSLVESAFSKMKGKKHLHHYHKPAIRKTTKLKYKKTEQVHICLGTGGPSQVDDERYPFLILETVLGGSMSSRLFQEIREKRGLAYSIYSYNATMKNAGLFIVYAGTSKNTYKQVIDLTVEELNKIKKHGITKEEMTRSKEHVKGGLVLGLESTSARMGWLAKSEFYHGKVLTIEDIFKMVDKVTHDDIIAMANKYIKDDDMTLTVIGDLKEKELPKI